MINQIMRQNIMREKKKLYLFQIMWIEMPVYVFCDNEGKEGIYTMADSKEFLQFL